MACSQNRFGGHDAALLFSVTKCHLPSQAGSAVPLVIFQTWQSTWQEKEKYFIVAIFVMQCERQSCCILKCHFGCLHQGHSIYWRILKLCINNVQGCKIVQEIPFSLCFQLLRGTSSSKNPWRDISEKSLIFFIGISMNVWFNKYILYTFNSRNFTFHLQTAEIELLF